MENPWRDVDDIAAALSDLPDSEVHSILGEVSGNWSPRSVSLRITRHGRNVWFIDDGRGGCWQSCDAPGEPALPAIMVPGRAEALAGLRDRCREHLGDAR